MSGKPQIIQAVEECNVGRVTELLSQGNISENALNAAAVSISCTIKNLNEDDIAGKGECETIKNLIESAKPKK